MFLKLMREQKIKAFPILKILITIAAIGIIAALIIPIIIKNKQINQYKKDAESAYFSSAQAFMLIKGYSSYLPGKSSYKTYDLDFKNDFMHKFKIKKNCGNHDECVASDKSGIIYKTLYGKNVPDQKHFEDGQFITKDGMFYAIDSEGPEVFITVDVNGYQKQPNTFGIDAFMFYIDNNGNFKPMGTADSPYTAASHCQRESWSTGWGCMFNVLEDINY